MKWSNYRDVYDLYINGRKVKRMWGKKHALEQAEIQSGTLFGVRHVELINVFTGEIIFNNKERR